MNEQPILFSGPMVRAILAGAKTQTRRVIRCFCNTTHINRLLGDWSLSESPHQWDGDNDELWRWTGKRSAKPGDWIEVFQTDVDDNATAPVRCNFKPGERLWARETFYCDHGDYPNSSVAEMKPLLEYRASHDCATWEAGCPCHDENGRSSWRPSIFMPRWASRLTLEITSIRVERVQDINAHDCFEEGIARPISPHFGSDVVVRENARIAYRALWDSINARRGLGWDANPWVWVIHFKL